MTSMAFTGGARIGENRFNAINYTRPLVTLTILEKELIVDAPLKHFNLLKSDVSCISPYRGLISDGLLIQHSSKIAPEFMVFWANHANVVNTLRSLGYPCSETTIISPAGFRQRKVGTLVLVSVFVGVFFAIFAHERIIERDLADALLNAAGLAFFLSIAFFVLLKRIFR
jgi:hypothetical protein